MRAARASAEGNERGASAEDVLYAFETAASASATALERGVVGRPIRAESWRLPSNSAPFDASTSQLATALAIASGRPNPASAAAYFGLGQILVGDGLARLSRNLGSEVRKRIGLVSGKLIDFAFMTFAGERRDGGLGVVGPGRAIVA